MHLLCLLIPCLSPPDQKPQENSDTVPAPGIELILVSGLLLRFGKYLLNERRVRKSFSRGYKAIEKTLVWSPNL